MILHVVVDFQSIGSTYFLVNSEKSSCYKLFRFYLVVVRVSTLWKKNALQIGSSPQFWVEIKNIWNHDFVPNKAIGWSFPQVEVNIQDVWNHHHEISLPLANPLYTPHSKAKILCPHVTGRRTCPNPADRGENHKLRFLQFAFFEGHIIHNHFHSASIVLQPKNHFHKFWKNSMEYTNTFFFPDGGNASSPWFTGAHRCRRLRRSLILDPFHTFLDDCWILIVLIHVVGVPNIDPHQAAPHCQTTAASLLEWIMLDEMFI